jgi:ABC-2 type transport system ATP-binding protein
MPGPAIQTRGLTRDFDTVRAVESLDLSIPSGIVFGFLGPNGSGKTTTIRMLLGLLEPTAGEVTVLGHDVRADSTPVRRECGALMEHSGLYERLSAEENLRFFARAYEVAASERDDRVEAMLREIGLWERRDEVVGTWSRGMKQKLAVARTLIHRPRLVILDEPTAGLDPLAAAALRDDLAALVEESGVTVFLTTHNLAEAERLCDSVGVIREGRLIATGSPADLRARVSGRLEVRGAGLDATLAPLSAMPGVLDVRVTDGVLIVETTRDASAHPVIELLISAGARIEEVRRGSASLEDAFLSLMDDSGAGDSGGGDPDAG